MSEWCTQQARQVIVQAQEEARAMGHRTVEAEYLLLGLLSNQDGIAGRLLADLGVTLEPTRNLVRERLGSRSDQTPDGQIPFSPGAQEVFRWASRWAFPLGGHDEVGSEHLLAGVTHLNDGARQILRALGVDPAVVRFEIKKRVAAPGELDTGPSVRIIRSGPLRHVAPAWSDGSLERGGSGPGTALVSSERKPRRVHSTKVAATRVAR